MKVITMGPEFILDGVLYAGLMYSNVFWCWVAQETNKNYFVTVKRKEEKSPLQNTKVIEVEIGNLEDDLVIFSYFSLVLVGDLEESKR